MPSELTTTAMARALKLSREQRDAAREDCNVLNRLIDDHVAEIERLKGLLGEYLGKGWTKDWEQRIRKASK